MYLEDTLDMPLGKEEGFFFFFVSGSWLDDFLSYRTFNFEPISNLSKNT
jgi:hypothetical protein